MSVTWLVIYDFKMAYIYWHGLSWGAWWYAHTHTHTVAGYNFRSVQNRVSTHRRYTRTYPCHVYVSYLHRQYVNMCDCGQPSVYCSTNRYEAIQKTHTLRPHTFTQSHTWHKMYVLQVRWVIYYLESVRTKSVNLEQIRAIATHEDTRFNQYTHAQIPKHTHTHTYTQKDTKFKQYTHAHIPNHTHTHTRTQKTKFTHTHTHTHNTQSTTHRAPPCFQHVIRFGRDFAHLLFHLPLPLLYVKI